MKKLVVRLFNVLYLAGSAFAIFGILTKPLIDFSVHVTVPGEQVAELMNQNEEEGTDEEEPTKSYVYKGGTDDFDIMSYLTPEKVQESVGDIEININLSVPAKTCLDFKNTSAINDLVKSNIENAVNTAVNDIYPKFKTLLKSVTKDVAKDIVVEQIKDQIKDQLSPASGTDADTVFNENVDMDKVTGIVDNIYDILDGDGTATVEQITQALLGEKNPETGEYEDGLKGILSDLSKEGCPLEGIDVDSISNEDIQNALQEALTSVPGLTTTNDQGEVVVNNIDTAILELLNQFLGDNSSDDKEQEEKTEEEPKEKSTLLKEETPQNSQSSDEELKQKITDFINGLIPFDLDEMDLSAGGIVSYILIGVLALAAFPWALFALITLIRTIRRRKCWTKPWVVFTFAFTQLIFGIGLTFLFKYGMTPLLNQFGSAIPAEYAGLMAGLTVSFQTSVLWASYIYLAMIPLTIVYIIICHGIKKDYKAEKRARKEAKAA